MSSSTPVLSPIQEADQARQVVGVLSRMERRFDAGRWERGRRFAPGGGNCLIGAIDEASGWAMPRVSREVAVQLAERLPRALQPLARVRPRLALATYNDVVGRERAMELVRRTRAELGGLPRGATTDIDLVDVEPAPAPRPEIWAAQLTR